MLATLKNLDVVLDETIVLLSCVTPGCSVISGQTYVQLGGDCSDLSNRTHKSLNHTRGTIQSLFKCAGVLHDDVSMLARALWDVRNLCSSNRRIHTSIDDNTE